MKLVLADTAMKKDLFLYIFSKDLARVEMSQPWHSYANFFSGSPGSDRGDITRLP